MDADALAARLTELCGQGVPGASVALTDGTSVVTAVHGVTSLRTQQPVTPATLFQIGSITKVLTATMVMALVDQGRVALDAPVQTYLPWFRVADDQVSAAVTVRHLLSHTAGFEGDDFSDTGRGEEALRRYVESLAKATQIHPLGAMFSYCNSGYSVLGALVEAVTGSTWDEAVQAVLAQPLGLTMGTLAEQVILHPHAVGHLQLPTSKEADAPTELQVAPQWHLPRGTAPAGVVAMSATDLLAFGQAHVDGGAPVLSPESVAAMQTEQVLMDDPYTLGRAWGLGWILPVPGVVGHDGATLGQYGFYRLHPESGTAMAILFNGPGGRGAAERLLAEFFTPLCGVALPVPPVPAADPPAVADPDRYVGDYERQEVRVEVRPADGGALEITAVPIGALAAMMPAPKPQRFVALEGTSVITAVADPSSGLHTTATFLDPDGTGRAGWVHLGARATPRKP